MPQNTTEAIYVELAELGLDVQTLKEKGLSEKAAANLLAGLKGLIEAKAQGREILMP